MVVARTPPEIARALEAVKKILDQNKNPMAAADVDHQYEDKYALVEFLANTGIAATLNVLEQMDGFNEDVLKQIVSVVQGEKRSMTLRLSVEEDCTFLEETTRTVESPTKHQVTVSSPTAQQVTIGNHQLTVGTPEAAGTPTAQQQQVFTHKTITEVKEYHWKAGIRHTLMLFAGTDTQHGIVVGTRTGTTRLVTSMRKHPYVPQTRPPIDLDLTWLVNQINQDTLTASFKIDREDAKTPRRNKQTEECIDFLNNVGAWSNRVARYFQHTVWVELLRRDKKEPCPAEWLSKIDANAVFSPVVPLFQEYTKQEIEEDQGISTERAGLVSLPAPPSGSPVVPLKDTTLFLKEQCASLQNALLSLMGNFPDPTDQEQFISGYEAKLVLLSIHLGILAYGWARGIEYVERMLSDQLVSAIGKVVKGEDFDAFLKFHNQRLIGKNYCPKPFCHAIRQPNQYPDGVLSIVTKKPHTPNNKESDAIETFSRHIPGDSLVSPMQIPLNAATTVDFLGDQYLHGWMDTHFEGEWSPQHFISARARQFSCFLLMVGNISGPEEFTPKDAIILQNKDEVLIPLLTTALPSAKEFRDAIQSLSPEQARFAKSYRSMQLDSSVFGICVIQVKPQMEALLSLPPNALTKEIQLTQDLLSLFVEFQIPPNLVSYDGDESASVADKVAAVKQHTKGVLDVIKDIKEAQLAEETKKAEMRAEQARKEKAAAAVARQKGMETERFGGGGVALARKAAPKAMARGAAPTRTACMSAAPTPHFMYTPPPPQAQQAQQAASSFEATGFAYAGAAASAPSASNEVLQFDDDGFDDLQDQLDNIELDKEQQGKQADKSWMVPSVDFSSIPKKLDHIFETFDKDGALRTMTLKTGDDWTRTRQENLLTKLVTTQMSENTKKEESNKALDLLDALSRSGSLPVSSGELHVVVGVRHSFEKNVMATVIQDNVNPIDKVDYSSLLIAASVHQVSIPTLVANSAEPPTFVLKNSEFPPLMIGNEGEAKESGEDDL